MLTCAIACCDVPALYHEAGDDAVEGAVGIRQRL